MTVTVRVTSSAASVIVEIIVPQYTLHPNARDSGPIWKDLGVSAGQDAVAGLFTAKDAAGKPIARTLNAWELRLKPKKGKLQELVKNEAKFPLVSSSCF